MQKINIMVLRHAAFYSPLLSTMSAGFLEEEGLQADYAIATADNSLEKAFANGRVDVAQSAVATSFSVLQQNSKPICSHFAQINQRDGFFLIGREANETNRTFDWQSLKGKRVLVDHFFQPMAMFNYALHNQGMSLADIDVIDAGDVDAIDQAFRQGEADFVHQQGPAAQQLEKDGIGHVVAALGDVIGPVAFSSLCATPQWLQTDMAKAFMRAYRRSCQYVLETLPDKLALQLAGFFPEIDQEVLSRTIARYQQLGCWSADPVIGQAEYEKLLDVFAYNGKLARRYEYNEVISQSP